MLAGVASIKAQQTRMNVIGNNLANVNTIAFKSSRVTFQDMLAQTIRGATRPNEDLGGRNPIQFGLGVLVAGTDVNGEQGSLNATNRPTDFAVQGNGFLMVSNGDRMVYTRDGAFSLDATGDMVHNATGERMLGWTADSQTGEIDTNAPIGPDDHLRIPLGARTAVQVTTDVKWDGNLDSREVDVDPGTGAGNQTPPAIPDPAYRTTQVRVFDELGDEHDLTLYVVKVDPNTWHYEVRGQGDAPVSDSAEATVTGTNTGTLVFDPATGALDSSASTINPITINPAAGAGAQPFDVDMDFDDISQLATETQVVASDQNGFAPGSLSGFSVGTDGIITGLYTNGLTRPIGQIGMAIFPNSAGMERIGNNLWRNTDNSGVPVVGEPTTGGRGAVNSGFLEQSNVDIGNEFTDLIITQRGFQANTKVVTTVDEMLQDLINMKR
jgi:flagellar hook protein FlgE